MKKLRKKQKDLKNNLHKLNLLQEQKRRKALIHIQDFTEYTKTNYVANWHHKIYCDKIDQFMAGDIKKLMVFIEFF